MLSFASSTQIFVATEPADMRKGIDGLCRIVEEQFKHDVYNGAVWVFVSRRGDRLKVLTWDAGGFVVVYKRLEAGVFKRPMMRAGEASTRIDSAQLAMLLRGIDLSRVRKPVLWEPPPPPS